jgi:protoheme IX farnesyltransferase
MVVVSSVLGYFIGLQLFDIVAFLSLILGGFLVTGSSNGMNQIIERNFDLKMERTKNRPIPSSRMTVNEAWIVSSISGILGISLLWFFVNPLTAILSALSLFIYVVLYTPLKRFSGLAVFVGAFPGAIPPMLGWVAATGHFGLEAGLLFAIQFMWQFPHFWAIAWNVNDDYLKGGFKLLPSPHGKNEFSAFIILVHSLMLIPVSLAPFLFGITGLWATIAIMILGILFALPSFKLFYRLDDKSARMLMFGSFLYLPLVLLIFFIDKL